MRSPTLGSQYERFAALLLDIETNVDSRNFGWYVDNLSNPVIPYWRTTGAGRLDRDWDTGAPVREVISVVEYFHRMGVADLYEGYGKTDITRLQAACINPWGFIGYQFGEPLLIDLGYYVPEQKRMSVAGRATDVPSYYASSLPISSWRRGRSKQLYHDAEAKRWVAGRDTNRWRGKFTGKDGLWSKDDLRTIDCQRAVLRRSLRYSLEVLDRLLGKRGLSLEAFCGDGRPLASVLAGTHLCGPNAVIEHFLDAAPAADEAGTSLPMYIKAFFGLHLDVKDVLCRSPNGA